MAFAGQKHNFVFESHKRDMQVYEDRVFPNSSIFGGNFQLFSGLSLFLVFAWQHT